MTRRDNSEPSRVRAATCWHVEIENIATGRRKKFATRWTLQDARDLAHRLRAVGMLAHVREVKT
jgi:uncharacterized protein affecting Mg2+/Co2+ transport